MRKTNIFFSRRVDGSVGRSISRFFGFQEVSNLGTYLGVPFFHEKVTNNTLHFVVDKTMMVPKGLCEEIEHIVWKFVWGSSRGSAKITLVGFNVKSNGDALWVWVLRSKYGVFSGLPENLA
ncbi:uncharacterized protein [Gossypium hirsutum]|uniref:Uncharacterized protein n=1 Tax=Gossypium hirsutum TaxID=3635 RepID=A0ABM2ZU45_GOSHI|nr:uncharacterized protein LOC121215513 [Gossypium hirsutum]